MPLLNRNGAGDIRGTSNGDTVEETQRQVQTLLSGEAVRTRPDLLNALQAAVQLTFGKLTFGERLKLMGGEILLTVLYCSLVVPVMVRHTPDGLRAIAMAVVPAAIAQSAPPTAAQAAMLVTFGYAAFFVCNVLLIATFAVCLYAALFREPPHAGALTLLRYVLTFAFSTILSLLGFTATRAGMVGH
ncbi:hypothetical protein [Paracraurococcus lichenis]|uniref:Yip1 domain-containing protein n=1 Tax=Paracraurococcus lichenis TaxID=3064888 RepID=A0ABT9EDJ5_9PROT|nr:hypothetical protein [Paracraurococcus sp. LOR1-02]MDO9714307.1 hypothetical protein [Paracraurococcus sp. LOR1-02]